MDVQYIYQSKSTFPSAADWKRILVSARKNNPRLGITGALFFDGQHYVQILEGCESAVEKLFLTICEDSRHQDVELVERVIIGERLFADWSMGFVAPFQLDELVAESEVASDGLAQRVRAAIRRLEKDRRLLARVIAPNEGLLETAQS